MAIRFHLDEHIASAIAQGLRRRGIDVTTTSEANLAMAPDEQHIQFALLHGRVIVTQDRDFLRQAAADTHHAGIIYSEQGLRSIGELLRGIILVHEVMLEEEMMDHVEYL